VVIKFRRILSRLNTTPSARPKDASRCFLDRAAFPSSERRGKFATPPLGNSPVGRGYAFLRRSAAGNARSCIVGQQAMKPARLGKPKCDISCGLNVG
jgi:hypothetical protein